MAYIGNIPAEKYSSLAAQHFTVTATASYTLTHAVTTEIDIALFINNVRQQPGSSYAYTATGTTLTLSAATAATDTMYCIYLGKAVETISPPDNSVNSAKIVDGSITNDDLAGAITESKLAGSISSSKITSLDATKLTGTVADARIPESAVAQHVTATDLSPVRSDILKLAIHQGIDGNRSAFNLEDSFIDTFEDDTGITTETGTDRNVSGEYVNSLTSVARDNATNIAPSSNDWDYTFDGSDDWAVAGNSLGDHTIGGFVKTVVHADSAISSLTTFDGDFVISFTLTEKQFLGFGVYAIDEDDTRAQSDRGGLQSMTNSYEWHDDYYSSGTQAAYGGSAEGSFTSPANGSTIVIRRVSGVITLEDDGSVIHTWGTSYSGTMRLSFHASGGTSPDVDNLFFTDTDKVQRDGLFDEGTSAGSGFGESVGSGRSMGRRFVATRTGTISSVKISLLSAATPFNATARLYSDDGTSPASALGDVSDTVALDSTGVKTFTFANTSVTKGNSYWIVLTDISGGSGIVEPIFNTGSGMPDNISATGRHDTITSITDSQSHTMAMEVAVDTSAGEPTPDHDTLLLIQDEGANDSQTFTDSSQLGLTCTANNQVHWDNVQNLGYGTTAIYVDGSDDHISLADHDRWSFPGDFTIDLILRCTDVSIKRQIYEHRSGSSVSSHGFNLQIDTAAVLQFYANASGGAVSALCGAISNNTNHHVCAVRSGNRLGLALDGTFGTVVTLTGAINNISSTLKFGSGVHSIGDFIGWMKRIRITNDARWEPGVNFTPPTGNYPITTSTTSSIGATGTLISDTQTASTSRTTASGVIIYEDGAGTSTLGTDLKIYFTANNGTNWTEASSYGTATTYSGAKKLVKLGSTTVTAGTQVAMKAVWANQAASKEARLHGWAVNY